MIRDRVFEVGSIFEREVDGAHDESSEDGELNIVPYLDILINLIMFLLVAQATLVSLGLIDVTAPTYSPAGGDPEVTGVAPNQLTTTDWCDPIAKTPWHKHVPARLEVVSR